MLCSCCCVAAAQRSSWQEGKQGLTCALDLLIRGRPLQAQDLIVVARAPDLDDLQVIATEVEASEGA